MRVMDVLKQVKAGARVMVNLQNREGCGKTYNLTDGTNVSSSQFDTMEPFLKPCDAGLIDDCEPQSYEWAG